jgi:hypothetical protein
MGRFFRLHLSFSVGETVGQDVAAYVDVTGRRAGVLFIAFNVDRRILYTNGTPNESDYADAVNFYKTFYEAPLAIKVCCCPHYSVERLAL